MSKSIEQTVREYRESQQAPGPAERWNKTVVPVAVEHDTSEMTYDGTDWRPGLDATFDDETVERFRTGWACLKCWEPQEEAFAPKARQNHLPHCRYDIRADQTRDFAQEFRGDKWIGPTTSLGDEYERMLEAGQRRRHEPGSSVLLPGKDF